MTTTSTLEFCVTTPYRVLFLITSSGTGGAENLFKELILRLDRSRFEPLLCSLRASGTMAREVEASGVPVLSLEMSERPHATEMIRAWSQLRRLFRDQSIDLVQTSLYRANVLASMAVQMSQDMPKIVTSQHSLAPLAGTLPILMTRQSHRLSDRVVAVSDAVRSYMIESEGVPSERIVTIPNGVDTERFHPIDRGEATQSLGLDPDRNSAEPIIGAAGRLTKVKGFDVLIESARLLVDSGRRPRILIAGEGPEEHSLQSQIVEAGLGDRVQLIGLQAEMAMLYAACDVFVLSSHREGSPSVVLEAMASERPVIATAVGGVPEIIEDGRSGLLVPPGEAEPLARAVAKLLDDEPTRQSIAARGRKRVVGAFDLDQITSRYEELYSDLVSPKSVQQPEVGSPQSQKSRIADEDRRPRPVETMTSISPHQRQAKWVTIVGFLLVLVLIGLRLIHLGADPPDSLWTESFGPFVDEGYKTLDARNLALFGQTHWNDQDDYPGWLPRSPITQVGFLAAFRVLGQEIESARLVTVLWFLLMLLAFLWATSGSYHPSVVYLGLVLLGVNLTLFAFSRLAIFEIPIAFFLLVSVLMLKKLSGRRPLVSLAVVLLCLIVSAVGIKASAVVYFLPLIAAFGLFYLIQLPSRSYRLGILISSALVLGGLLIFFFDFWMPRLDLDGLRVLREFLASPAAWAHPLLVSAAFLAIGQGLYEDWRRFLSTPYRVSLIAICVGAIFLLSLFSYNPLRYYVPILPVFVLLVLEWLQLGPVDSNPRAEGNTLTRLASGGMLFLALLSLGLASNRLLLGWIVPEQYAVPSYVAPLRFTQVFLIAAVAALLITLTPALGLLFKKRVASSIVVFILFLSVLVNATSVSLAIASPSQERARISREVEELLPRGASIGGDWAPLFAIGTELKALYMNQVFNAPERVKLVRPDYLLLSDTVRDEELQEDPRR